MLWHKCYGDPLETTLIFLHGFMGQHQDFEKVIQYLSKQYFCVAIDLPGHGQSRDILPDSVQAFDEIILKTLQKHLTPRTILVGYSLGGRIALKMASLLRLSGLVLLSSKVLPLSINERQARHQQDQARQYDLLNQPFINFLKKWYSHPIFKTFCNNPKNYKAMLVQRIKQCPKALAHIIMLTSPAIYFTPLNALPVQTLYLAGQKDTKYISELEKVHQTFPNAKVATIEKASHAIHLEKPKVVATHIQQLMRYIQ